MVGKGLFRVAAALLILFCGVAAPDHAEASFAKAKYISKSGGCRAAYGPHTYGKTRYDSAFLHVWNNTCWSCPAGYHRTVDPNVKGGRACRKKGTSSYAHAKKHHKVKFLGKCPKGQFLHVFNQTCYSCPRGYHRSANPNVAGKHACVRKTKARYAAGRYRGKPQAHLLCPKGTFFDLRKGGQCWTCPRGYHRTINGVTSRKACTNDFRQIFAVDTSAVCKGIINGLRGGVQGAQKVKATVDKITGPVLRPVQDMVRKVVPPLNSPKAVDRMLDKIAVAMRPRGDVIKEVARVGSLMQRDPGRIGNILLNANLMCEGGPARINRALIKAGINPNFHARRRAGLLDGLLVGSAHAATSRGGFHVVSFSSGGRPADKPAGTALTVSIVTNFGGGKFGLFISTPALILATQPGLDVSVGYMYFADAVWDDFDQMGQLGVEVDIGVGNVLKKLLRKAGNVPYWPNAAFVASGEPAFFGNPRAHVPGFGFSLNWAWDEDEGKKKLRVPEVLDISVSGDWTTKMAGN